jgi:hypothetical protein
VLASALIDEAEESGKGCSAASRLEELDRVAGLICLPPISSRVAST